MEFWSGFWGTVLGAAIALVGTVFSSLYTYHCQQKIEQQRNVFEYAKEQRKEKIRIYTDLCGILERIEAVVVVVPSQKPSCSGKFDAHTFAEKAEELHSYCNKHAGELALYMPSEIYSELVRFRSKLYELSQHDFVYFEISAVDPSFFTDLEVIKGIKAKAINLQNCMKYDLESSNKTKKRKDKNK